MSLKTDFNQSPYFDDFDETKNFHRVLFKPAVAVQARELTQLQTILQNQIERFGDNILTEGTIVQGGNFVEEKKLAYAKLLDIAKNSNNLEVATDVNQYVGLKVVGLTNGLEAIIIASEYGLESQSPNLSTIYIKYTKFAVSNGANIKSFAPGEALQLYAKDSNGDYSVPYHVVTVATTVTDSAPIGAGYGVRCGEGVIYQKGHFIRFTDGLTIVSKYSNTPDSVVVGFETVEEIVNSTADSSLLDNANGFNNENAPGADRLKLSPSLVVKTIEEAANDDTFFAIQEYANGKVVRRKLTTQYNVIEKEMERRTSEESGDYVVSRFGVSVQTDTANTSNLNVVIDPGIAYVDGQRVELVNSITLNLPEANTHSVIAGQDINTNYGSYVIVNSYKGQFNFVNLETVNLYRSADLVNPIGTARVRSVTKQVDGNYRIYLMNIVMSSTTYTFGDVAVIKSTSGGSANTIQTSGLTVLKDASFNKMLYPVGKSFIKSINTSNTDFVYRTGSNSVINSNTLILTVATPDVFPYTPGSTLNSDDLLDIIVVANSSVGPVTSGESISINSATVDSTGQQLTISLAKNPGANLTVNSYYNVKKKQASLGVKTLKTIYVKIQANTNANGVSGPYCLGVPDAYELMGVWKGSSTTTWATLEGNATSESGTNNVTGYFMLDTQQSDGQYSLSSIKKKVPITIAANDKLIAKIKVFEKTAGTGHFFTIDSYPIDDSSIPLPVDKIRTENVPIYASSDGSQYLLRDVIDLRPYVSNTATYATAASSATINPVNNVTFGNIITPAPNKTIEATYSYYLGRNDIVIIDKNGNFELIQGTPSENPSYPQEPSSGMLLARIVVPPYPTLSTANAQRLGKPEYGVGVSSNQTLRYTMKDIAGIEQRIKNIEYYTSLSLLETSAKDFLVTDSAGNDRFKNGIFVDNFENLYLADVKGGEFAAAVDASVKNITPKIRQYPINLKVKSVTNAVNNSNKFVTLPYVSTPMASVSQSYATSYKNCTTSFYNYVGKMQITPSYDSGPDTVIAPDVNFSIDLTTPFIEYTEALSQYIPLTRTNSTRNSVSSGLNATTTATTTTTSFEVTAGTETVTAVGDFVRDVSFSPFMRSRDIEISVVGLRPNTRFYFFFDGVAISNRVAEGVLDSSGKIIQNGEWGAPIISSSDGTILAVYRIPAETFYVGDRKLELMDVSSIDDVDASTSYASATYSGFNFSSTQSGTTVTTRPPQIGSSVSTGVSTNTSTIRWSGDHSRDRDPIAQTFIIDSNLSDDTHIFVTKLDLFFAKKSKAGKGVTVQLREVVNGYPTGKVIPFSEVHLKASQVNAPASNISTNALVATTVEFDGPIALKVNTEYAIAITPDGNDPDYLVWIAKTGEIDVDTSKTVVQDSNAGVLFTSTNNSAWTPYQNENLKFTLYSAGFTSSTGSVLLTNNDNEFFSVQNINGTFDISERIFPLKSSFATGTVSVTANSNVISGSSTLFLTDYQVNEYMVVKNGDNYYARRIKAITTNTSLTLESPFQISSTGLSHYGAPVGTLVYINDEEPPRMILEDSTAKNKTGMVFEVAQTLYGESSGTTAEIVSIDDLPMSYIQPAIYRSNFTRTRTSLKADTLWNGLTTSTMNLDFNDTNYLYADKFFIRSKSSAPAVDSFVLNVTLDNVSSLKTSPVIDHEISSVMVAEYIINGANTTNDIDGSELIGLGEAKSKYVSKVITLADGLDAEDFKVILGAYRPTGTDIRVYARLKSGTDTRNMKDVEWSRLELKAETNTTSSSADRYDYREYVYQLSAIAKTKGQGAWDNSGVMNYITTIDSNDVKFNSFKYFAIKIVMLADSHNKVPRLKDVRALALS